MNNRGSGDFIIGAIFGAAIAGVTALLFAPQSGEKTRRDIRDKANETVDQANQYFEVAKDKGNEIYDNAVQTGEEQWKKMTDKAEQASDEVANKADQTAKKVKNEAKAADKSSIEGEPGSDGYI